MGNSRKETGKYNRETNIEKFLLAFVEYEDLDEIHFNARKSTPSSQDNDEEFEGVQEDYDLDPTIDKIFVSLGGKVRIKRLELTEI